MDQYQINIRKIRNSDAKDFNVLKKQIKSESPYMLYDKEENLWTDLEQEAFIKKTLLSDSPYSVFVAVKNQELIGFIAVMGSKLNKKKHIAEIAMGVLKKSSGQGVGSLLLECAKEYAKENGLIRLELSVICENTRAKELYKRHGFIYEGTKIKAILLSGHLSDEDFYSFIL